MSQQPINLSPDLRRLKDEGYDVEIKSGHLLIKQVPYVNASREIKHGTLVSTLDLAGDVTVTPKTHVAHFAGEHPCRKDGSKIGQIEHSTANTALAPDLVVHHSFSSKPPNGYTDYYEKMTTYIAIISSPAHSLDPSVTPTPYPVVEPNEEDSVFNYIDTASSRAGIGLVTNKLALGKLAIVGLGGTGSYVLDLVAKTPVREIHLFDGDKFLQHNAFRSPGAPFINELKERSSKVAYFKDRYSRMHRHIFAHDYFISASNVDELQGMDFVFLCLDKGSVKKPIVKKLEEVGISFIDVGMGVNLVDESLIGVLRVTSSTAEQREHVRTKNRIPFADGDGNDAYQSNIQIADLNALNAAFAVIKWKKLFGFYLDLENENNSTYTIDGNHLWNEDQR